MSITIPSPADFCSSYPVAVRNHLFLRFRETLCRFTQPFNTSLAPGDHDGPAVACDPFLPSKFQLSRLRIRGFRRVATSFQPGNLVFSDDLLSLRPWIFPARNLGNRSVITPTGNFDPLPFNPLCDRHFFLRSFSTCARFRRGSCDEGGNFRDPGCGCSGCATCLWVSRVFRVQRTVRVPRASATRFPTRQSIRFNTWYQAHSWL